VQEVTDDNLAKQLEGLALQPAEEEVNVSAQTAVKVEKSKKTKKKAKKGE
jgi:hypothetical protein